MKEHQASADRLRRLQRALQTQAVCGYLATSPVEVSYLSNFGGEDSYLFVPARGKATLLTDFRYAEDAAADCPHLAVRLRKESLIREAVTLAERRSGPLALNPDDVTVSLRHRLVQHLGAGGVKELPEAVSAMRTRKDAVEVAAIERALRVAEKGYGDFLKQIRVGMTESDLAAELDYAMRRRGADAPAFPTICAIGPNASKPHARPGSRRLTATSPLLVDFGAAVGGYRSDLTRMVFLARMRPEVAVAYRAVLEAQEAAIRAAGPGVKAAAVDAAARGLLTSRGYGKAFGHGTGHGLGREVHELPYVSARAGDTVLEPGMVVTIEPGVYLPGRFGIRIEDDVLITADGCRVLSRLPKAAADVTLRHV